MRLLSWNVQGKLGRLPEQAANVASLEPDLVCLQEVTRNSAPLWEHALTTIGLEHQFHEIVHYAEHRSVVAAPVRQVLPTSAEEVADSVLQLVGT